jgi:ABC-type transport system involved in multi-copper enzyme maturation permease subunit
MKIIGRIIGSIISAYVGWMFGSYIINMIKNVNNPLIRLAYLCLFVVCCVIIIFIFIDIIFKTHIAERIIATLVSNVLWNLVIFAGLILLRGYKSTVLGVSLGVEVIRKMFRGGP